MNQLCTFPLSVTFLALIGPMSRPDANGFYVNALTSTARWTLKLTLLDVMRPGPNFRPQHALHTCTRGILRIMNTQ